MWKGDIEEERRVFYVALTRAMDALYLIGSSRERSEFIEEIKHLLVLRESTGTSAPEKEVFCLHCGERLPPDSKFCSICGRIV